MSGVFKSSFSLVQGTSNFTATLAITTPVQYKMHQRNGSNQASIAIAGTHSGIVSGGIEASFNGGAYQTIVASPSGGTFSGTLTTQAIGQGTLTVRCVDSPSSLATKATVGVGDIYVITGDSNHYGAADDVVQPSSSNGLVSVVYKNNGTWAEHTENNSATGAFADPTDTVYSGAGTASAKGSYFGALATLIMNNAEVPVAFIPQGIGSTTIANWATGTAGGGGPAGFNVNFSQDVMGCRIRDAGGGTGTDIIAHKAVLCTLGTNGGGTDQADYETKLNAMVDGWMTYHGGKTVLCLPASPGNAWVVAGTQAVINSNADALQGPDFDGVWSADGIHYLTTASINAAAKAMWDALNALFYGV